MTLQERVGQLRRIQEELPGKLENIAQGATMRAVEKAQELTPPTMNDLSGSNTRTGDMKAHWQTDSQIVPQRRGDDLVTGLNNDMEYSSYVNDGHRMDRHFVPGLVIDEATGMLYRNPDGRGGIVVGTKTSYVPGLFMTDAAKEVYQETVRRETDKIEEMFK